MTRNTLAAYLALTLSLSLATACDFVVDQPALDLGTDQQAERWDRAGAPSQLRHLGENYEYRLAELPTSGEATQAPWAGYYWATFRDAINLRWAGAATDSPTAKYAKAFGIDPTQLEDAVSAKSGIDSQRGKACTQNSQCTEAGESCAMRSGAANGICMQTWFGQCHAWAPAALMEPEPTNPVTVNGVTFRPQDIKALMTYVYNNVETDFLGGRCNELGADVTLDEYGRPSTRRCRDTNPGAMHVVLANWLGLEGKAIVEDRTWDHEVWNQPVSGFEAQLTEISESTAAALMGVARTGGTTVSETGTIAKSAWRHFGPFAGPVDVRMTGTGDADLYVRAGAQPTSASYDCRPYTGGSEEHCTSEGAQVYVSVNGWAASSDYELTINYGGTGEYVFNAAAVTFYKVNATVSYITESNPSQDGNLNEDRYTRSDKVEYILELDAEGRIIGGEWLTNDPHADFLWVPYQTAGDYRVGEYTFEYAKIKDLLNQSNGIVVNTVTVEKSGSVARDEWKHYGPFKVASGELKAQMTGSGDADLYVRRGGQPTSRVYDCRPYDGDSSETCTSSGAGDYYVSVNGFAASSDFALTVTYLAQ